MLEMPMDYKYTTIKNEKFYYVKNNWSFSNNINYSICSRTCCISNKLVEKIYKIDPENDGIWFLIYKEFDRKLIKNIKKIKYLKKAN